MDVPLEIAFVNMDPSEFIEARVREKVDKLEKRFPRLVSCRVAVELPHRRHQKGNLYHVRIDMSVPGKELVVSRAPGDDMRHRDVYVAIEDAFQIADRQLSEFADQIRGDVKEHVGPLQGKIIRLFPTQDYGFIATTDGREIYFHRNSVVDGDFDDLERDQAVELVVANGESPIGPQASTVRAIRPMQYDPQPSKLP